MHNQKEIPTKAFKQTVENSTSIAEAARVLGMSSVYVAIRAHALGIQTKSNKHLQGGKRAPITAAYVREAFLSNNRAITSSMLREYLIKTGIKEACCEWCKNTEWNGYPIPLELHHKNQNHDDNSESNLMILCPTCHALITRLDKLNNEKEKKLKRDKLKEAKRIYEQIGYPESMVHGIKLSATKAELLQLFKDLGSYTQVAKALNVTDNAIKKRCKRLGILEEIKPIVKAKQRETAARNRAPMTEELKAQLRAHSKTAKAVDQFDKVTLELVATYPSTHAAANAVGSRSHNIADCCKGRKLTCKGYIWKYH